jgi:hypothetical protein
VIQEVTGTITIRQHCTFRWRQPQSGYQRIVDIEDDHCKKCIAELIRLDNYLFNDRRKPPRTVLG